MNYDQPRQLQDGGGWRYTRRNDDQVWALGYCRDHPPHATPGEARACYTGYLLTERLRLDGQVGGDVWHRCQTEGCDTLTDRIAEVDGWHVFHLCDAHRNREHVAALFGDVGDSAHS